MRSTRLQSGLQIGRPARNKDFVNVSFFLSFYYFILQVLFYKKNYIFNFTKLILYIVMGKKLILAP